MDGVRGPQGGRGSLPPPRPPPAPRELLPRVRRRPPGASLRQESRPRRPGASAHGHAAPPGRYSLRLRVRHCQLLPSRFQEKRLARPAERAGGVLGSRPFRGRPSRTRTPLDGSPRGLSGSSCSSRFHFLNVRGLTRFVRKQTVLTQQCPETDACVLTRSAASV